MYPVPLDVIETILDYAHQSEKASFCRTSKTVYPFAKDALYRHLRLNSKNVLNACFAISGDSYIQTRVQSFVLLGTEVQMSLGVIQDTLTMLPHLHTLILSIGYFGSWILPSADDCPFQLHTFKTGFRYGTDVIAFLTGQKKLKHLAIHPPVVFEPQTTTSRTPPGLLEKLTSITGDLSVVQEVVPGRPIHEVTIFAHDWADIKDYTLLDCLAKSVAKKGIERLSTSREYLHLVGGKRLASIAPNLTYLVLDASHIDPATKNLKELFPSWMERLISRQRNLQCFTIRFDPKMTTIPCQNIDFSLFITKGFETSTSLTYLVIAFLGLRAKYTCKRVQDSNWLICDNTEVTQHP
ncbi:hypothetical protein BDZ94DRAFT_1235595 [Collybia nuda]|uniref:F-box domain-containing protein n=1 Tax=Collybia nuda TaxID=64659 RepID=A0A9P5Y8P0_9AGAR|nr:hypothetical protein BDZ94DRAFT_1235595 [Collybia nuda]